MKIEQVQPEFTPITITLETLEEAQAFMCMVRAATQFKDGRTRDLANKIAEWFNGDVNV